MTPGIQSKAALGKDEPRAASSERRMLTQRFRFINRGRNQSDRALHPLTVFHGRDYDGSQAEDETVSVVVYRTWSDLEAQLVKGILELYGIPVGLSTDISHILYPFTVDGLGETRILVPLEAERDAQTILDGHRSRTGRLDA